MGEHADFGSLVSKYHYGGSQQIFEEIIKALLIHGLFNWVSSNEPQRSKE